MKSFPFALIIVLSTSSNGVDGHSHHVRSRVMFDNVTSTNGTLHVENIFGGHAEPMPTGGVSTKGRCGTLGMTEAERQASKLAVDFFQFKQRSRQQQQENLTTGEEAGGVSQPEFSFSPKVIPVCFHVVGPRIRRVELTKNLEALNRAYSQASCCDSSQNWCPAGSCSPNTNIRFVMARSLFKHVIGTTSGPTKLFACVKRRRREVDMDISENEAAVKKAMHVGDGRVLNVYYTLLSENWGYAYYPSAVVTDDPKLDGVVIHRDAVVGGPDPEVNEGDTLAHEVGHWLGLDHTFAGECSPGDYIDDTPAEADANYGCNPSINRDTCPNAPGLDPIHNFMDYSDDVCLYQWTQGQIIVMHANIEFYRSKNTPDLSPVLLSNGTWSDQYTMADGLMRQFNMDVPTSSTVVCETTAVDGDINLYVNWNGGLDAYDCLSETDFTQETCTVGPAAGRIYAFIYSYATTVNFQVRCSRA